MENAARKIDNYTYADYKNWGEDIRCEIIDGYIYNMSPAPSTSHQQIVLNIASKFESVLKNKKCKPFIALVDVLLDFETNEDYSKTIVQPDVLVVGDKNKIKERGIFGVPDLVIEVASPSTIDYDFNTKKELYRKFGVPEYWIVLPSDKSIIVYNLEDTQYKTTNYIKEGIIESKAIKGLSVDITEVF